MGSNIAIFLKKNLKKAKIYSLDNLMRKGSSQNRNRLLKYGIKNFKLDIQKFEKLKSLNKFNLIIDCCAEPAIEISKEPDRVFNTNLVGTFNVLKNALMTKQI